MSQTPSSDWPKAVLFDLDGTLIDSAPDIHAALNQTLASYNEPPFLLDTVKTFIGGGAAKLIERAYAALGKDLDPASRDKIADRFVKIYEPRSTELTVLRAGVSEVTRNLKAEGRLLAIVTNKPEVPAREILSAFGLLDLMDLIVGGDAGPPMKPDPGLVLFACDHLGIEPGEALFVGDSENDIGAGIAAGVACVAVEGGYTAVPVASLGADAIVETIRDLPDAIDRLRVER